MFEIPIFHYAPSILRKFGAGKSQIVACLAYVTRVLGYSLVPKNHMMWILCLEPLHGVTYALSQTSAVDFFAQYVPPGYEAQGQGIMNIFRGLGSFVGLSLGGWAEQTFGPRIMYRGFALAVFLAMTQFSISTTWDEWMKYSTKTGTKDEKLRLISDNDSIRKKEVLNHV